MEQSELGKLFLIEHGKRESVISSAKVIESLDELRETTTARLQNMPMDIIRRELQAMSSSIMQTRQESRR